MRYRIGRTVRLVIGLAFLVLLIPLLMSKLDSGTSRSTGEDNEVGYTDVRKNSLFFLFINLFFGIFRAEKITNEL
jgi:hypothetical protein